MFDLDPAAIALHAAPDTARAWLIAHHRRQPGFVCVLGFTETALIPGISAAGATPAARRITAIADAEYLATGGNVAFPLPPLTAGASPVLIARAAIEGLGWPLWLGNAGLPVAPATPCQDLNGQPARCVTTGQALPPAVVERLFRAGLQWGASLAAGVDYLLASECVVGGTTTALGVLEALGIDAAHRVGSSHPTCNHQQKIEVVRAGLKAAGLEGRRASAIAAVSAVGDPMQPVVAGMAIAASRQTGVLLAGGSQMLAVWALARAYASECGWTWHGDRVLVGTTRWVMEDATSEVAGLAQAIGGVALVSAQLRFDGSPWPQLQAYERGFVKEGVGAGGAAIAAHLSAGWTMADLASAVERQLERLHRRTGGGSTCDPHEGYCTR